MKTRLKVHAPDRITAPAETINEAAWRAAVQPVDAAVQRIEDRWGSLARLQRHGTPETVGKFGAAWHKFNEAIEAGDPAAVAVRAGVVVRGLAALETEAGDPALPAMVAFNEPGNEGSSHVIVVGCNADAAAVAREFPAAKIYTAEEVALLLRAGLLGPIDAVKDAFPGSTINRAGPPRSRHGEDLNDAIPF